MKRSLLLVPLFLVGACGSGHSNAPSPDELLMGYDNASNVGPYVTALDALQPRCDENLTDLAYAVEAGRQQLAQQGYTGTDLDLLNELGRSVPAGKNHCTNQIIRIENSYSGQAASPSSDNTSSALG